MTACGPLRLPPYYSYSNGTGTYTLQYGPATRVMEFHGALTHGFPLGTLTHAPAGGDPACCTRQASTRCAADTRCRPRPLSPLPLPPEPCVLCTVTRPTHTQHLPSRGIECLSAAVGRGAWLAWESTSVSDLPSGHQLTTAPQPPPFSQGGNRCAVRCPRPLEIALRSNA